MNKKTGKALVVGAGISGTRSALDLAETGYNVTLIDSSDHMGGLLTQLDYQFPTNHCGMCRMLPLINRDDSSQYCLRKGLFHENINILPSTELISAEGESGNFQVTLKQKPRWVDPNMCIGCNACAEACPVEIPDIFNEGMTRRKAIYLPIPHSIPNPYVIDYSACTQCGECVKVCPTNAIRLSKEGRKDFRILVVDDELIVRNSLKEWLETEGFFIDSAESGDDAVNMLSQDTYHLMLTDIKMPGMDGVELLKKAKEANPELTVVMMTAYATVETAVEAMKIGALDYLVKPFDPENLIPMILKIYEDQEETNRIQMDVGSVVLCGGTEFYDPLTGKNLYGHGVYPNVFTSIEFERLLSGTGPTNGKLLRKPDNTPVKKIGWIQCVGSRDIQTNADFCSNICCMYALKEAVLAREKAGPDVELTIYYMDMRTFGKPYQRYRDEAEKLHNIKFERTRIHSVDYYEKDNDLVVRCVQSDGTVKEISNDMLVLSVGQRPAKSAQNLADSLNINLNDWGFFNTEPFSLNRTVRDGIYIGGGFSGLKDINESVIQASSAALSASRAIHSGGGSLMLEREPESNSRDVSRELPEICVLLCTCNSAVFNDTQKNIQDSNCNRVLIGACLPHVYANRIKELSEKLGINRSLFEVVDIRTPVFTCVNDDDTKEKIILKAIETGITKLKHADPVPGESIPIIQSCLVVGGGIAGMTAALAVADHGYRVEIVEKTDRPGGNLLWIDQTIDGHDVSTYLEEIQQKVNKHPLIDLYLNSRIISCVGEAGKYFTTIEDSDGIAKSIEHGASIIATGGGEGVPTSYSYGASSMIITQKDLETGLKDSSIDPLKLNSLVMIQCADCREEPKNYCSRVCCNNSVKQALKLKEKNPDINIYIIYRDMMTYGFSETYYTQARNKSIFFIQYDLDRKPDTQPLNDKIEVSVYDPVLREAIKINADLVVLASGIVPNNMKDISESLEFSVDQDGFFAEAEYKWRPVDSIKEGVFACGLARSPGTISETIASAEAAAQRSLRILSKKKIASDRIVAKVHHAICSLCQKCIDACPYGARALDIELDQISINPVMCQGCGSCAAVCPNNASHVDGFLKQQMLEIIDVAIG